ncbi:hypothetical protein CDA63_04015 [Hymenobacter amundsenii]|uniref:AsmA domain-containing protein n=1 Tax=Hymenobacter amundsenii TaxID=2006685 RepID=A0A246FP77_9BACT|nr:hypothetical protein CDA63_04015 [Hymenobacter amundsenii]
MLGGLIGLALVVWLGITFGLDPWLQRTLENKVRTASHGRYRLQVGRLRTNLRLRQLDIRAAYLTTNPTAPTDTLPTATVALGRLHLRGVGLWALLRGQEVPIDSLRLDSVAVALDRLPAGLGSGGPIYAQLPGAGLRIGYLTVRHVHGRYGPAARPQGRLAHADLTVRDLRLSAAGAADSARIGYAAAVAGRVRGLRAQVPGHALALGALRFATRARQLILDSLAVHPSQPIGPRRSAPVRVSLALPRLVLTGLNAAALVRRRFRADSLGLHRPGWPSCCPPPSRRHCTRCWRPICASAGWPPW